MPDRYTTEWSVDLSGMKRNSLPSEGLFNHVPSSGAGENMSERERRGKAGTFGKELHREHRGKARKGTEGHGEAGGWKKRATKKRFELYVDGEAEITLLNALAHAQNNLFMIDSPFDIKEPKPLDGVLAAAFLFFVPFGGSLFGWVGTFLGDHRMEGELFGSIGFYALSVGFSISALRQPNRSVRIWGGATLLVDLGILLLLLAGPVIR